MSAADFILAVLIGAVAAGVAALIALPFVYLRGMRQIDRALEQVFTDRDRAESVDNVRRLRSHEAHRRMVRKLR